MCRIYCYHPLRFIALEFENVVFSFACDWPKFYERIVNELMYWIFGPPIGLDTPVQGSRPVATKRTLMRT